MNLLKILWAISFCFVSFFSLSQTNTYTGTSAGNGTTGGHNSSYGYYSGDRVIGTNNSFFGSYSGRNTTSGQNNSFFGFQAGSSNILGNYNTFLGYSAGQFSTKSHNTYIGYVSGANNTGDYNTFVGSETNLASSNGQFNVLLGYKTGFSMTTGYSNTYIGTFAGKDNTTGNTNTFVGSNAGASSTGSSNVFIGYYAGLNSTEHNKLFIDNSSTSTPLIYGDFSTDKVGINSLPITTNGITHTLSVNGTIYASGIYVNGQSITDAGFEFWTKAGNNVWNNTGNVGIGTSLTSNPNNYKLAVNGKLGAKEVQIENNSTTWPDFVFMNDYKLMTLIELEKFIKQNGHLPEIPSAEQVQKDGILVGEMNAKLLQKVEELTLYVIELEKKLVALDKKVSGN